jgi:hypothetical protein
MRDGFETSSIGFWPGRFGLRAQAGACLATIESGGDSATASTGTCSAWRGQAYPSKSRRLYAHEGVTFCIFCGELNDLGCGRSLASGAVEVWP